MSIVYLAGGETWGNLFMDLGVKYQLMSYLYLRQQLKGGGLKVRQLLSRMKRAKEKGYSFILDSGAFTYQVKSGGSLPSPADYFQEYLEFVLDYGDVFDIICEFDVDGHAKDADGKLITVNQVDEWTNTFFEFPSIGYKVMPVWNKNRGIIWLDSWLKDPRSPYVGYSSALPGGESAAFISRCHAWGKWTHGFGQTSIKTALMYAQFDSVDSTSVGPETLVWVREAGHEGQPFLLPIEELYLSFRGGRMVTRDSEILLEGYETLTLEGGSVCWKHLRGISRHEVDKPCYRLTLSTGREIVVTKDHSLMRMDKHGEMYEVKPGDLHVGDWLLSAARFPWSGTGIDSLPVSVDVKRFRGSASVKEGHWPHTVDTVIPLSPLMLTFFGLWIAEGSYSGRTGIRVTNTSEECIQVVKQVASFWATNGRAIPYGEGREGTGTCWAINGLILPVAMRELGFESGAPNKQLPLWFWGLSREQACHFLRGMFSGDGGIIIKGYGAIRYTTTSKQLAYQLQHALMALIGGPISVRRYEPGEIGNYFKYVVSLTGARVKQTFMKDIGFLQECRAHAFPDVGPPRKDLVYGLPLELKLSDRIPRPGQDVYVRPETKRVGRWASEHFHPTVTNEDICFLNIESIELLPRKTRLVYDLSVPETEVFQANGVVAKNTWLRSDKYGGTCVFQNNKWIVLDHTQKAQRSLYRGWFESHGLDWKKIRQDDLGEMRRATIIAWRELAAFMEKQDRAKDPKGKKTYLHTMMMMGHRFDKHPKLTR